MGLSLPSGSITYNPPSGTLSNPAGSITTGFSPLSFFNGGANGFWLDNDPATWFEDSALTIPATFGNPIGGWVDKSPNGINGLQSTAGSRLTYGRMPYGGVRNQLLYTQELDNATWTKSESTISANATTAPDGTTTADKLVEAATSASHSAFQNRTSANTAILTTSVYLKAAERTWARVSLDFGAGGFYRFWVNLSTGAIGTANGGGSAVLATAPSSSDAGNGWWRVQISASCASGATRGIFIASQTADNQTTYAGDGTSGIYVWGAQLEMGSAATAYQAVVEGWDVTESGVASVACPWFDGVDDFLDLTASGASLVQNVGQFIVTSTVNFTAALSQVRMMLYTSTPTATTSRASLYGDSGNIVRADGRRLDADSGQGVLIAQSTFQNTVFTGDWQYSNSDLYLRKNGVVVASTTSFQTAGATSNTAAAAVYIGRYNTVYAGGFLPSLFAIADTALSDGQLLQLETYMAQQIGVTGL